MTVRTRNDHGSGRRDSDFDSGGKRFIYPRARFAFIRRAGVFMLEEKPRPRVQILLGGKPPTSNPKFPIQLDTSPPIPTPVIKEGQRK